MKLIICLLLTASSLLAQPYTLDWFTTDAGGGTSSAGSYALSGTIGQPDTAVMSGGNYRVEGGFWPGLIVASTLEAPMLVLEFVGGELSISWTPATPGFVLEQTGDLMSPIWFSAPAGNPVMVPLSENAQFFQLRKP